MPKVEQKEEKKSESEDVIGKSEAQNPRVGHNNATPTVSAPQAPGPKAKSNTISGTKEVSKSS